MNRAPQRARWSMVFGLAALLALTFPQHAGAAAAGDPDLTFHEVGWTTVPMQIGVSGFKFAVLEDGRMVAAGRTGPTAGDRLVIHRYLADGSPDVSFNGTGTVITDAAVGRFVQGAPEIAFQPDGKILAANLATGFKIVLVRFLADGTLDPDFGEGSGFVATPTPFNLGIGPHSVAVQSGGDILLSTFLTVWRFGPSGARDLSFAEPPEGGTVKVLSDDKILQCRNDDNSLVVQRLHPGGAVDSTFGVNGTAVVRIPAAVAPAPPGLIEEELQIEVLPDGRIWIGGELRQGSTPSQPPIVDDLLVMRLLPNGAPDATFNGSGVAVFNNGASSRFGSILPQPDGGLVLVGNAGNELILMCLRQDGTPDGRFGTGGRVAGNFEEFNGSYYRAAITPDAERRILVAGLRSNSTSRTLVLRRYVNLLDIAPVLEYPRGTRLENAPAQPMDFGAVPLGARIREFTLGNLGYKTLTGLTVYLVAESHAGEYTVNQPRATTLAEGEQTTFLLTLSPQSPAPRTATLRITGRAGDAAEDLLLFSTGLTGHLATASEVWRYSWFGSTDNAGTGADLTDFDGDGLVNLLEDALGANPHQAVPPAAQAVWNGNVLEYTYTRPAAALTEVDYLPEAAASPAGPWSTAGLTSAVVSETGGVQTVRVSAAVPEGAGARFVRLRVSRR